MTQQEQKLVDNFFRRTPAYSSIFTEDVSNVGLWCEAVAVNLSMLTQALEQKREPELTFALMQFLVEWVRERPTQLRFREVAAVLLREEMKSQASCHCTGCGVKLD